MRKRKKSIAMVLAASMILMCNTGNPVAGSASEKVAAGETGDGMAVSADAIQVNVNPPALPEPEEPVKAEDTAVWNGKGDFEWDGKGTEKSPFLIYTPEEFAGMLYAGTEVQGMYFLLMNDIDLGGKPLRSQEPDGEWGGNHWGFDRNFCGYFDGQDHVITGFWQSVQDNGNGLFGTIGMDAVVKNLVICGRSDKGYVLADTASESTVISNITSYVNCYGDNVSMIGSGCGTISYCVNYGEIVSNGQASGIVDRYYGTEETALFCCYNYGDITVFGKTDYPYAGGIVGYSGISESKQTSQIIKCMNFGTIKSTNFAGGISGYNADGCCRNKFIQCENYGEVSGAKAGGIAAPQNWAENGRYESYSNCINKAKISGTYNMVGIGGGKSYQCYSITQFDGIQNNVTHVNTQYGYTYGLSYEAQNCYYVGNAKYECQFSKGFVKAWSVYPEDGVIDINGGFDYFEINELSKCQNGFPVLKWEKEDFLIENFKEKCHTRSTATICWNLVPRATGYEIYSYDPETKEKELLTRVNTLNYTQKDLQEGESYSYIIRSYMTENNYTYYGDFSDVVTINIKKQQEDIKDDEPSDTPAPSEDVKPSETPVSSTKPSVEPGAVSSEKPGEIPTPVKNKGDINGDGTVNLLDAQIVLKAALKITTLSKQEEVVADVNGDGSINLSDAQWVLKVALKIITR